MKKLDMSKMVKCLLALILMVLWNLKDVYSTPTKEKPKITVPSQVVRTVRGHYVWCSADGTPPIYMSLRNSSTVLDNRVGIAASKIHQEGDYTCIAKNDAGTDSKHFAVTFSDCRHVCVIDGSFNSFANEVDNIYDCTGKGSATEILKCIPTTTTHLSLKGNEIVHLPERVFFDLGSLQVLDLRYNKIVELPEGVFSNLRSLRVLYLRDNEIVELPERVFSNLRSLEYLYLRDNKIVELPEEVFSNTRSLRELDLRDNKIVELPEGVFSNLRKLLQLYLGSNKIVELPEGVFSNLTSLMQMDLHGNKIVELPERVFSNLRSLYDLYLDGNKIVELPERVFSNLRELRNLFLKGNTIVQLPERVFSILRSLQYLDLDNNKIVQLPERVFSDLRSMMLLHLKDNQIVELPERVFSNLTSLTSLNLKDNQMVELPERVFSNLTSMRYLDLGGNKIVRLPETVFSELESLKMLFLLGNKITSVSRDVFANLGNLQFLFLQGNEIYSISRDVFANLGKLQYLFLSQNRLQEIPAKAFKNMNRMKMIMLSDNPLKTIGRQAFTLSNGTILLRRTELQTVNLWSFDAAYNLTSINVKGGQLANMKFMDAKNKITVHIGSGQYTSYDLGGVNLDAWAPIISAFTAAGFAIGTQNELKAHPCPLGTYMMNASVFQINGGRWMFEASFEGHDSWELPTCQKCPSAGDVSWELPTCQECPAGGYYSDTVAFVSDSCRKCPTGTFVDYDKAPGKSARDCTACPQGTDTDKFAGLRACDCLKDFYRTHLFKRCQRCDKDGWECVNDTVRLKKGYWWNWENETHKVLYETFTKNLDNRSFTPILRDNNSIIEYPYPIPWPYKCPREESCNGGLNSSCARGYEGPLCEVCIKGYYKQLKVCRECPSKNWMIGQLFILVAAVAIVVAIVVWSSKRKSKKSKGRSSVDIILGRLKIVIGFYQVTSGILEACSDIKWPDSLAAVGKYSEVLQVNVLQIAPIHCLYSTLKFDAFKSLFAMLALNAAAIIVALAGYAVCQLILMRKHIKEEEKLKKTSYIKELIYRNLFFFLYVIYLNTCLKTASVLPLACRTICGENEKDCKKYLKADFTIECKGPSYYRSLIVAYCAVFYIFLLPTACLVAIWRERRALRRITNKNKNKTRKAEDQSTDLLRGLRFIYENYNPERWYWELVETVRKVILTSGLILVGGESRAYIGLACVLSGLYGMFFAHKRPIRDPFENTLMLTSLAVTFVNLGIGAVSRIPQENIPSSIDPYVDKAVFNALVIVANSLVIGLLVVQYVTLICRFIKVWRQNPQWSFSCCLALVLPLNELQGEIRGFEGKNINRRQLKSGKIEMPTVRTAIKESGALDIDLEDDETSQMDDVDCSRATHKEDGGEESVSSLSSSDIRVHEPPTVSYETCV